MKANFKYIIYIIAVIIGFSACTEEVDLQLNETYTRLVVEGELNTDTTVHIIKLSKSTSYFDSEEAEVISNAQLSISDGTNTIQLIESANKAGHYYTDSNFYGELNTSYTLEIKNVDIDNNGENEEYTATSKIRSPLHMDSVKAVKDNFFGIEGFRIFGFAQEPPTYGDKYLFKYYINGELSTDTLNEVVFTDDEGVNGNYINGLEIYFIDDAESGDTITIEAQTITNEYYDYIISFMLETEWQAGAFGGPPANIKTNISNGALGFFNTYAKSEISFVLP